MKNLLNIYFIFFSITASAQYGFEWIDASKPHYKIGIAANNVYRISYSYLLSSCPEIASANFNDIAMYNIGNQVPIYISWAGNAPSSSDYIEFYGKKLENELDKKLYSDTNFQLNPFVSLFKDSNFYFLTLRSGVNLRLNNIENDTLSISDPYLTYCWYNSVVNFKVNYNEGRRAYYTNLDYVYSAEYDNGEGWGTTAYTSQSIPTPNFVNNLGLNAKIHTRVFGRNEASHRLEIKLNGTKLGEASETGSKLLIYNSDFASSLISGNSSTVTINPLVTNNHGYCLGAISIKYPRNYNFSGQGLIQFSTEESLKPQKIKITNYNNSNSVILLDLVNQTRIVYSPSSTHAFYIESQSSTGNLILTHQGIISNHISSTKVNFSNLLTQQGKLSIISHKKVQYDSFGVDVLLDYKAYKQSTLGGGVSTNIAYIDDVENFFGYGIPKHPLAIRKYLQWANNTWTTSPIEYAMIIAKGYSVNGLSGANSTTYANNLIPSFGHSPSDYHYATMDGSLKQFIPIGRLSASDGNTVRIYLNKLKEFNAEYLANANSDFVPSKKEYMKWIIHLGGGNGSVQQGEFRNNLKSFETKIKDTSYGARVFGLYKNSPDISEDLSSVDLTARINKGVGMITFFGHSSASLFDVGIGDPKGFTNKGKYPFFLANGCNSGFVFSPTVSYSENFINLPDKGAIGFLATTNNALDNALYAYSDVFYNFYRGTAYNQTIGKLMMKTSDVMMNNGFNYISTTAMDYNLNGDPSVMLTQYPKADYHIDANSIIKPTNNLNTLVDSFQIKVIVQNLGKAITSKIKLKVERINGSKSVVYEKLIDAPYFKDTIIYNLPTIDNNIGLGSNQFNLKIDADDKISEMSEINNELKNVIEIFIESSDIIPIFPYEYSITGKNTVKLVAMTTLSNPTAQNYYFEFDTSELYNSPLLKKYSATNSKDAIVTWTPDITLKDSTVYYWRVRKDSTASSGIKWNSSSFIYIPGQVKGGWNQSHYFQYLKDDFQNIQLPSDRSFKYINDIKNILIRTDGSIGTYEVEWYLNNARVAAFREQNRITNGMFIIWIDGKSGIAKQSYDSVYGAVSWGAHGSVMFGYPGLGREGFVYQDTGYTPANHPRPNTPWSTIILDFLNQIPNGDYVLFYTLKKPVYNKWDLPLVNYFKNNGFPGIQSLVDTLVKAPFIFGMKKNDNSFTKFIKIGTDYTSKTTGSIFIQGVWKDGFIKSPKIGPTLKWNTLSYQLYPKELPNKDTNLIELIGYNSNNQKSVLAKYSTDKVDTSLTWINPNIYTHLELKLSTTDNINRTPSQLKFWRIYYDDIGEVAVNNTAGQIPKVKDTIENGEEFHLYFGAEVLNNLKFDSLSLKVNVNQGSQNKSFVSKVQSINGNSFDVIQKDIKYNEYFVGENNISYEINTKDLAYQKEKYDINNFGKTNFFVKGDIENPLLDVTFDGQRIINNELVSASPKIKIVLKDENKFLLMNDTSLVNMFLKYPDGSMKRVYFYQTNVTYTLANSLLKNIIEIQYNPRLTDGNYQLVLKNSDRSGNSSSSNGNFDYAISFNVITKNQISQFLNYPNPFTSSTRFVFTLTGTTLPDYIKIQIVNIRGQVVKEILKDELGPIKIGVNKTQYAWNGRDQFGDILANGVYLYKVIVKSNEKDYPMMDIKDFNEINNSKQNLGQYFTNGWGKMVIIR